MKTELPLFTIEQTVQTYKYLFTANPSFGIDVYSDDYEKDDVIILDDNNCGSQGIPIHFGYYAFFLRVQGVTKRSVNQFEYVIEPQAIQLVNPGSIYSFKDITQDSRTFVLLFSKSFIQDSNLDSDICSELLEYHQDHQQEVLFDAAEYAHVFAIYEQISDELKMKQSGYRLLVKMLINQLLVILKRRKIHSTLKHNLNRAQQISAEFLLLIEENYLVSKSVKSYADMLSITPKHLSETVKTTLHHSALYYIHIRIIKEIQYLLCFSELSIKQISYTLNFDTLSQFGRFFKRYEKMSPKTYRLHNRFEPVVRRHE